MMISNIFEEALIPIVTIVLREYFRQPKKSTGIQVDPGSHPMRMPRCQGQCALLRGVNGRDPHQGDTFAN
jgi:hypothetical protein